MGMMKSFDLLIRTIIRPIPKTNSYVGRYADCRELTCFPHINFVSFRYYTLLAAIAAERLRTGTTYKKNKWKGHPVSNKYVGVLLKYYSNKYIYLICNIQTCIRIYLHTHTQMNIFYGISTSVRSICIQIIPLRLLLK